MSNNNYSKEHIEFLRSIKRKKRVILITQISILVIFFIAWELLAKFKLIDTFLTSYPSQMWKLFLKLSADGSLFEHIGISVFETVVGFVLGTVLGTLVAILLWWSDFISKVLDPYMVILNALPKTALAPIIIVWAGAGISGIIVTALMVANVISNKIYRHASCSRCTSKFLLYYYWYQNYQCQSYLKGEGINRIYFKNPTTKCYSTTKLKV